MKRLAANKKGIDTRALSLIIIIPALAIILTVFFIWLRNSSIERSEGLIKSEISSAYAREQALAFLKSPAKTPIWRNLHAQSPESVAKALGTFYKAIDPRTEIGNAYCNKKGNVLDCYILLFLQIPLSELGLLNPYDPLFTYRATASLFKEEFVNEIVPVPTPNGLMIFKLKGERVT